MTSAKPKARKPRRGASVRPGEMTSRDYLRKHNWELISSQKMGFRLVAWWLDPLTGQPERQGTAMQLQRERNRINRKKATQEPRP